MAAVLLQACNKGTTSPSLLVAPTLSTPADDTIALPPIFLTVNNASSTLSGPRTYDFQVADSQATLTGSGSGLLASASGVAEGTGGLTAYRLDIALQPAKRYFWRARVSQGGKTSDWSNPFRFRSDYVPNAPPVIQSLTSSSDRAEINASIQVTALVQDQETSPASLIYEWTAQAGLFTGSGPSVSWRAPGDNVFTTIDLTLTVIERYTVTDPDGRPQTRENRTTGMLKIHINNSPAELSNLALTFLDDFVHSERSPEFCVRNFSDSCPGKQDELSDIRKNREQFVNDPSQSSFNVASITYNTPGNVATQATFATVLAPCNFAATNKSTGAFGIARGTCRLTNVYENFQWRLCDSNFLPPPSSTSGKFEDAFSARFIF